MPKPQEIIVAVQKERGRLGRISGSVDGMCRNVGSVAEELGGCEWYSTEAKAVQDQVYPGHAVGVVPSDNGTGGFVIDFTVKGKVIIGEVTDVQDDEMTARELEEITGYPDWRPYRARYA